jgi:hypothetical protein
VRTGQLAQRLTILDPASAEDVLIIPRMVGG